LCLTSANASCIYQDFEGWKDCFVKDKLSTQMEMVDLDVFREAQYSARVIELDRKQPEKKLSLSQYLKLVDLDGRAQRGRKFMQQNKKMALRIAEEYGVEPEIIVALIGMESDYGAIQGKFNVVDALATLAYEGRRREFFEGELLKILTLARNEGWGYDELKGSWAGAMGQTQFMPSSYLAYAVDYDHDGKANIWESTADAMASAANYLKKNGWVRGQSLIKRFDSAKIPAHCDINKKKCAISHGQDLRFIEDDGKMKVFLVGGNFDVLMKWNRSTYFGVGVLTLASKIKEK
jgi:membrane-bound lytic murein transglycosylase B